MPSGLALANGHVDTKHFTDVLGYTRCSFVQNPAARIIRTEFVVRIPLPVGFVTGSKILRLFVNAEQGCSGA